MTEPIIEKASADRYAVRSLMEEAITSSQIEGALTTRRVAKDMIRSGRPPRDTSERMILNNYRAMQKITDFEGKVDLSKEVVLDLHRVLTSDTMEEPSAVARFRRRGELIRVMDPEGQVMHDPPATDELPERFARMCAFANGTEPDFFIHPVVRSIILHFWLAYDHPFVDGNGRCARALFYWSMLRHGYWLCEFISISEVIKKAYAQYGRAFLHTETDDNDLTYFILYHLNLIDRAVEQLDQYIDRKTEQQQVLDRLLRRTADINHRQKALLSHALRHPDAEYTIRSHMTSHDVSYETSRKDLMDLEGRNLLESLKVGREFVFVPVDELERRVRSL
jgi:Fic family protein